MHYLENPNISVLTEELREVAKEWAFEADVPYYQERDLNLTGIHLVDDVVWVNLEGVGNLEIILNGHDGLGYPQFSVSVVSGYRAVLLASDIVSEAVQGIICALAEAND